MLGVLTDTLMMAAQYNWVMNHLKECMMTTKTLKPGDRVKVNGKTGTVITNEEYQREGGACEYTDARHLTLRYDNGYVQCWVTDGSDVEIIQPQNPFKVGDKVKLVDYDNTHYTVKEIDGNFLRFDATYGSFWARYDKCSKLDRLDRAAATMGSTREQALKWEQVLKTTY